MRDRKISIDDLNRLRLWIESKPEVPEGLWYKDFKSSKSAAKERSQDFLLAGQSAKGQKL